jgi:hypothetical protein
MLRVREPWRIRAGTDRRVEEYVRGVQRRP